MKMARTWGARDRGNGSRGTAYDQHGSVTRTMQVDRKKRALLCARLAADRSLPGPPHPNAAPSSDRLCRMPSHPCALSYGRSSSPSPLSSHPPSPVSSTLRLYNSHLLAHAAPHSPMRPVTQTCSHCPRCAMAQSRGPYTSHSSAPAPACQCVTAHAPPPPLSLISFFERHCSQPAIAAFPHPAPGLNQPLSFLPPA